MSDTPRTASATRLREEVGESLSAGEVALAENRLQSAERALIRALDLAEQVGEDVLVGTVQLRMGEVRLRLGDHGAARASAVAALEIFGRLGRLLDRARGCRLLGIILRESGAGELAERHLEEAVEIARAQGATALELQTLPELASLYRAEGRPAEALSSLARLRSLLRSGSEPAIPAHSAAEAADRIPRLFGDVARDLFVAARPADLAWAARVVRIADALATEIGLDLYERAGLSFTASVRVLRDAQERQDPGGGWPAAPTEPALRIPDELSLGPLDTAESAAGDARLGPPLALQVVDLSTALAAAKVGGDADGLGSRILAAAAAQDQQWDAAVLDAAARLDWSALLRDSGAPREGATQPSRREVPAASTTILVVDDDPEVRTIISDYFGAKGYRVATAASGEGLFGILSRVKPDLLLLDIMLPGRDGRTLLERIRASLSWSHVPVIVITGIHDPAEATRTLRAGADDWVEKPLDPATLQARVERLLSLRRALREAEKHRARQELLLEIIRELTGSLDTDQLLNRLVRRIAEATGVAKCSLVLTDLAGSRGTLTSAYDNPTVHGLQLDLQRYPEVRRAIETVQPVVVPDISSDPLFDEVRRRWAAGLNVRSSAVIPLVVDDEPIGAFLIRTTLDEPPLDRPTVDFATQVTEAAGKALEYARLFERISADLQQAERQVNDYRSLSLTDPLTGLANRAGLESKGTDLFLSARALGHPLSVMMLDLDNFKDLNDTHGHAAGDAVLRSLGATLAECAQPHDLVARYGGDEFCIVLPYRGLDDATRLARLVVERIESIALEGIPVDSLRASIGVATYPLAEAGTLTDLIARADRALYRAKAAGGAHVQVAAGDVAEAGGGGEGAVEPVPGP